MARADVSDYLELIRMEPGRHVFALTGTRELVEDELGSESAILAIVDDAIAQGRVVLRVDLAWDATKKAKSDESRGGALLVKNALTRQLTALHSIVRGRSEGDDEVAAAARHFLDEVFPDGVAAISSQTFELMLGQVQTMLSAQFENTLAKHVKTLGVQREIRRIGQLTARLAEQLRPAGGFRVSHADVEEQRHALHEATSEVVVAILHATSRRNFTPIPSDDAEPMTDEDRVRVREALLAPINFQQELVREAYSQHRQPLDVDPTSGEELDPDEDDDVLDDEPTDPNDGGPTAA